jgi:hypothetical protein
MLGCGVYGTTRPSPPNRTATALGARPDHLAGFRRPHHRTITDPDPHDLFILEVNWGDATPIKTCTFGPGTSRTVSVSHRYQDNPSGAPSGSYTINLHWMDQHGAGKSATLAVAVANVAP